MIGLKCVDVEDDEGYMIFAMGLNEYILLCRRGYLYYV